MNLSRWHITNSQQRPTSQAQEKSEMIWSSSWNYTWKLWLLCNTRLVPRYVLGVRAEEMVLSLTSMVTVFCACSQSNMMNSDPVEASRQSQRYASVVSSWSQVLLLWESWFDSAIYLILWTLNTTPQPPAIMKDSNGFHDWLTSGASQGKKKGWRAKEHGVSQLGTRNEQFQSPLREDTKELLARFLAGARTMSTCTDVAANYMILCTSHLSLQ